MKMKRSPLSKRIPRELVHNAGKYLGMVLILVCTIAVGSSFQVTLDGAVNYLDMIKKDNVQEDGFFETLSKLPEDDGFYAEKGVALHENFYATENSFLGNAAESADDTAKVLIFNERKKIDIPVVFEGKLPQGKNEIAIDHAFAYAQSIKTGDTIKLLDREFYVTGTVSLPDYTALYLNNTDMVMNTAHFCVAVVTEETFADLDENTLTYRYSYRIDDRNLSLAEKVTLSEDIQKHLMETGAVMQAFLRADQNQSISFLEADMGTDGPMMTVFVYILVGLIAFIFALLTNNTIERESVIIGTLRASGYQKSEIIWHYLQPTLIVAVAGSVIGNLVGYTLMIKPFLDLYYTSYSIGPLEIEFSVPSFILTTVLPVVIMLAINFVMLARKLSLSPLKFLRRELKKGRQKKAVRLPDFSFLSRFRLRVILQNKGSYILLFIGIFLASFLLMFGIGLGPLVDYYTESIDESLPYDYQYILKAPVEDAGGEKVRTYEMDIWYQLGKKDVGVSLMGIDRDSRIFDGALPARTAEGEVTVSTPFAKKLNLKEGDTILLKDKYKDEEHEFKVAGIYSYDASMAVFIDRKELNSLLDYDEDSYNCLLSDRELDIDDQYLAKKVSRSDLLGAASQMMDSFASVILFINVFSIVVYVVLMYILTKVVIDKNALSISFMKVFGYEQKEIRKLYLTTTSIVVIASLIVCIPLEIAFFKVALVFVSVMMEGYLEFYLPAKVYIEIIAIGIVAYYCINALHVRGVKKIPMAEALKNRE